MDFIFVLGNPLPQRAEARFLVEDFALAFLHQELKAELLEGIMSLSSITVLSRHLVKRGQRASHRMMAVGLPLRPVTVGTSSIANILHLRVDVSIGGVKDRLVSVGRGGGCLLALAPPPDEEQCGEKYEKAERRGSLDSP
jgi:hypothetical protein